MHLISTRSSQRGRSTQQKIMQTHWVHLWVVGSACRVKSVNIGRKGITQEWLGRLQPNFVSVLDIPTEFHKVVGNLALTYAFHTVSDNRITMNL